MVARGKRLSSLLFSSYHHPLCLSVASRRLIRLFCGLSLCVSLAIDFFSTASITNIMNTTQEGKVDQAEASTLPQVTSFNLIRGSAGRSGDSFVSI